MTTARASSHPRDVRIAPLVPVVLVLAALVFCAVAAGRAIHQPGYLLDEEITASTVPSVSWHGVPRLPSGLLYVRGLPFTYAAWLGGSMMGHTLDTYRLMSAMFALLAIGATCLAGALVADRLTGAAAAVVATTFTAFAPAAAFARPYTFFMAAFALTLASFFGRGSSQRRDREFLAGLAVCRLLHEFGSALMFLPLLHALVVHDPEDRGREYLKLFWKGAALIVGLELVLFLAVNASTRASFVPFTMAPAFRPLRVPALPPLHVVEVATATSAGVGVVVPVLLLTLLIARRTGAWVFSPVCGLLGVFFQLGGIAAVSILTLLARPRCAGRYAAIGGGMMLISVIAWTAHTMVMTSIEPSWTLPIALSVPTLRYPLTALESMAGSQPAIALAVLSALVWLQIEWRHPAPPLPLRTTALFSTLVLVALGALGVVLQPRFLLLASPVLAITAAYGIVRSFMWGGRVMASVNPRAAGPLAAALLTALLTALMIFPRGTDHEPAILAVSPGAEIKDDDVLICSEELACVYLFGRVDYLLLGSDIDLAYYSGRKGGKLHGLYAGAPVIRSVEELSTVVASGGAGTRYVVAVFETGKVQELECLDIVRGVAARYGEIARRVPAAWIVYLKRDAAGISSLASRAFPPRAAIALSIISTYSSTTSSIIWARQHRRLCQRSAAHCCGLASTRRMVSLRLLALGQAKKFRRSPPFSKSLTPGTSEAMIGTPYMAACVATLDIPVTVAYGRMHAADCSNSAGTSGSST